MDQIVPIRYRLVIRPLQEIILTLAEVTVHTSPFTPSLDNSGIRVIDHATETHVYFTGTGTTDLFNICSVGTSADGRPILGFVTPDSGASWFFIHPQKP